MGLNKSTLDIELELRVAKNKEEFFAALADYTEATLYEGKPFPKVVDLQRKYWRYLKKHTGETNLMTVVLQERQDKDFPLTMKQIAGEAAQRLVAKRLFPDEDKPVNILDDDHKIDDPELAEYAKELEKERESVKKTGDPKRDWLDEML